MLEDQFFPCVELNDKSLLPQQHSSAETYRKRSESKLLPAYSCLPHRSIIITHYSAQSEQFFFLNFYEFEWET